MAVAGGEKVNCRLSEPHSATPVESASCTSICEAVCTSLAAFLSAAFEPEVLCVFSRAVHNSYVL